MLRLVNEIEVLIGGKKMDINELRSIYDYANPIENIGRVSIIAMSEEHKNWLIAQAEKAEWLQYTNDKLQKENDSLCDKLADIRNLFDESDMKAEGHGMEDAIASPYAVTCYAENKLIRLIKENRELQEELDKWIAEFMI
jgi:hypothetical protein